MKSNLFKKIVASAVALTMVVGTVGIVPAAHAANGENVATQKWTSFSVCTREDGGKWEDALKAVQKDDGTYFKKGVDYWTEGSIVQDTMTSSYFDMNIINTGWEGQYFGDKLMGDNEWAMTAQMTNIPIEKGRKYTISFKIKSTLVVKNKYGTVTNDEKQITFKAYRPTEKGDNPGVNFSSVSSTMTTGGYIKLKNGEDWKTVTATVVIPNTKDYNSNYMGVQFAMGTFFKTRPEEAGMSGNIYVKDFKVTAGTQYTVTYNNGGKKTYAYVNAGGKAVKKALAKKGYTLVGYKDAATGLTYNFSSAVNKNIELIPVWKKTAKPGKAKIAAKCTGKKKVKVTIKKKAKNAVGYEIQYSLNKKFKKAKKYKTKAKTTTKKSYTIKKLTSKKIWYVRVRAYAKDSAGNKVYGKYSSKKVVYVK